MGQKKKWTGAGPGECEPNLTGSREPDRFRIIIKRESGPVFLFFPFSFSFFFISRERGSALSLEFRSSSAAGWPVPVRWPTSHRGCAAAPDAKQSSFFNFFRSFSSIHSPLYDSWPKSSEQTTKIPRSRIENYLLIVFEFGFMIYVGFWYGCVWFVLLFLCTTRNGLLLLLFFVEFLFRFLIGEIVLFGS